MTGLALTDVLRAHLFTLYPGEIACDCGWTAQDDETRSGDDRMIAAHVEHQAAAVTAWLAERLASDEVREAVAEVIADVWMDGGHGLGCEYRDEPHDVTATKSTDAALAAVVGALAGES